MTTDLSLWSTRLYRYWKGAGAYDHFYTTNPLEIGTVTPGRVGRHGYKSGGVACRVLRYRFSGSVPLYRYYQAEHHDHFYTINPHEIGTITPGKVGRHGYRSEGIVGYCYPARRTGTVPLDRFWKRSVSDHFYTINIKEADVAQKHGYVYEGVACYVIST